MATTRVGVCGPWAAYPGGASPVEPGADVARPAFGVLTRYGVCGASGAYPGFTSKGASAISVGVTTTVFIGARRAVRDITRILTTLSLED